MIVEKDGDDFVVTCPEFPGAVARAPVFVQAIDKMKKILRRNRRSLGKQKGNKAGELAGQGCVTPHRTAPDMSGFKAKTKKKKAMLAVLQESLALRHLSESLAHNWRGAGQFLPVDVEKIRRRLNGMTESLPELRTPLARVFVAFDNLVEGVKTHHLRKGLKEAEVCPDRNPLHPLFASVNAEVVRLLAEIGKRL